MIYDENFPGNTKENQYENWQESIKISNELMLEANIKIRKFSGILIDSKGLYQGNEFEII